MKCKRQRLCHCFLFMFLACGVALAQEQAPVKRPAASVPITVAATGERVRFTAVGPVERMRLEVFDPSGVPVFDTGFKPGNVHDWTLRGAHGQVLADSNYLCVVTVRELSGRLTFRQGSVLIEGGQAALALEGAGQPEAVETEQALTQRRPAERTAMTVVAHDGRDGQVTSTAGDLTFRTGDVFSGKDKEQMRLTEDGKLGIGTKEPQATLDVAGTIRASKAIVFPDGTALTSATGRAQKADAAGGDPQPLISGSGTTGRLTKWTNGPAGTVGDSIVTESSSNIGIGTGAPTSKLHVVGAIQIGATSGPGINPTLINPNAIANFAQVRFYPASGTNVNTSFAVVPKGTGQPSNKAQFSILGTDSVANPSNVEFATFRARGTDFVLSTGKTGTGQIRPLILSAGLLTDNVTNNNQLVLSTDGAVGIGTNAPLLPLDVAGPINAGIAYWLNGQRMLRASGTANTFVGASAGDANLTGTENSFLGDGAGAANDSGKRNSFFGAGAGAGNTDSNSNSYFGRLAGQLSDGKNNAFFGADTGLTDTAGDGNTLIGSFANVGSSNLLNATAIGHRAYVTQNNSLVLGSINTFNGASTDINVGIGTPAPKSKLHVVGGDIFIAQPNSLIITSPNGSCFFITVNNSGTLSTILVTCPS